MRSPTGSSLAVGSQWSLGADCRRGGVSSTYVRDQSSADCPSLAGLQRRLVTDRPRGSPPRRPETRAQVSVPRECGGDASEPLTCYTKARPGQDTSCKAGAESGAAVAAALLVTLKNGALLPATLVFGATATGPLPDRSRPELKGAVRGRGLRSRGPSYAPPGRGRPPGRPGRPSAARSRRGPAARSGSGSTPWSPSLRRSSRSRAG